MKIGGIECAYWGKTRPDFHEGFYSGRDRLTRYCPPGKDEKTRRPESSAGVTNQQRGVSGRLNDCAVMMSLKLGPESVHQLP